MCKQLTDYLLGQNDGQTKNPKYIFKMYISMGNFVEAAKTAVIIALDEQAAGNYRQAHDLLFECYRKLRNSGAKVPADIDRSLAILHSYVQVKVMVKLDDHDTAARLLKRVADNISKFPARRKRGGWFFMQFVASIERPFPVQTLFRYSRQQYLNAIGLA